MIFAISDAGGLTPVKEESTKSDQKVRCEAVRVQLPLPCIRKVLEKFSLEIKSYGWKASLALRRASTTSGRTTN